MKKNTTALLFFLISVCPTFAQWQMTSCNSTGPVKCMITFDSVIYAGTIGNGVFQSADDGSTWDTLNTGLSNHDIRALAMVDTNLYAGAYGGGVFLYSDTGTGWSAVNTGLPPSANIVLLGSYNHKVFAGTDNNGPVLYNTVDSGATWTSTSTGVNFFSSLAVLDTTIIAGTYGGTISVSLNGGAGWFNSSTGLISMFVRSVVVKDTMVFAGTDNGVYVSYDKGASWSAVNNGLTSMQISCLAVSGNNLYAGTFGAGVFMSSDNGANWSGFNTGLLETNIYCLLAKDFSLFAGTSNNHIWKYSLPTSITNNQNDKANQIVIYPNPTANYLSFQSSSENNALLQVKIYSLNGTLVKSCSVNSLKATINVADLSNGIYMTEIISNGNSQWEKLVIQR